MADLITWLVVIVVCVFGIGVFYKALKEPMDLILGGIVKLFLAIIGRAGSAASSASQGTDVLTYG